MQDDRLVGKPTSNDGSLPIMWYDYKEMPITTLGIWHAQGANSGGGWPSILTYDHKVFATMTRAQKRAQMDADGIPTGSITPGLWRDEYPFASTVENAGSTFVTNAPIPEQRTQAIMMLKFYREHSALKGLDGKPFYFEVKMKNIPQARKDAAR